MRARRKCWADRPEHRAPVRNPHTTTSDGCPKHVFAKRAGEWVCAICEPELFMLQEKKEAASA